jgi:Xaa-Pro aminopeptidase
MSGDTDLGLLAPRDGGRVDFAELRSQRRQRLVASMRDDGADLLLLGRPSNVAFASGARQLWTSGFRPYSPGCVVEAATGRVHLLSTWDSGVPAEIGHEDLFGLTWNPSVYAQRLKAAVDGYAASLVATDGWSVAGEQIVLAAVPEAQVVDATPILRRARDNKSPAELFCISTAASIAESAMSVLAALLTPGITGRQLQGGYAAAIASLGAPTPPTEAVAWTAGDPADPAGRPVRVALDRVLRAGELVAINPGAFYAGYEAGVGRTFVVGGTRRTGQRELQERCREALDGVISACLPGATGADLVAAWDSAGVGPSRDVLARGVGLGAEEPVIGPGRGSRELLSEGMVLSLEGWAAEEGVGGVLEQDVVAVGGDGPRVLTRYGRGVGGS